MEAGQDDAKHLDDLTKDQFESMMAKMISNEKSSEIFDKFAVDGKLGLIEMCEALEMVASTK